MTLDQLRPGDHGTVVALDSSGAERRRLMDLGLLPGTEVRVHMRSPLGDPTAYRVRGSVIALRRSQAQGIQVDAHDPDAPRAPDARPGPDAPRAPNARRARGRG